MPLDAVKVTYSRTVQVAQFEPRKVEIEISFTVGKGQVFDDLMQEAKDVARQECLDLIKKRDRE